MEKENSFQSKKRFKTKAAQKVIEYYLQQAVYEKLKDSAPLMSLVTGVYDRAPQVADSGDGAEFPYVVIGEVSTVDWSTDTELGARAVFTVHVWSRKTGFFEVREIQDAIYQALNRQELAMQCYRHIMTDFETSDAFTDSDGETQHGTQTFLTLLER